MNAKCSDKLAKLALLGMALSLLTGGCSLFGGSSKPRGWNVNVTKSTPATIRVDLIGVSKSDKSDWAGYDINKYWAPGDLRRKEADKVSYENLTQGKGVLLRRDDPQWQKWFSHGANELLVIADLPGEWTAGADDPRRKFLPLAKADWDATDKTLEIEIQNTRIRVLTPQISHD